MEIISSEYFIKELLKFREMMGEKKYWVLSADGINAKIDLAYKGLAHLWFRCVEQGNASEADNMHFEAATIEYTRRAVLIETHGLLGQQGEGDRRVLRDTKP